MSRLGGVILDRLSRPDDVDQEAEELWRAARRERLAYQQLLDDLRHTPDVLPAIPGMSEINSWTHYASTIQPATPDSGYGSRNAPKIEILEIGWRR